jgi:hypothetical protein
VDSLRREDNRPPEDNLRRDKPELPPTAGQRGEQAIRVEYSVSRSVNRCYQNANGYRAALLFSIKNVRDERLGLERCAVAAGFFRCAVYNQRSGRKVLLDGDLGSNRSDAQVSTSRRQVEVSKCYSSITIAISRPFGFTATREILRGNVATSFQAVSPDGSL